MNNHAVMNRTLRNFVVVLSCSLPLFGSPLSAEAPKLKPFIEARFRLESTQTPIASASLDRDYAHQHARVRLGLDLAWRRLTLHGALQGTALSGVPSNAGFGIGPVYLAANRGDTSPEDLSLAEFSARYQNAGLDIAAGRQRFADGIELLPGIAYLDDVQRSKLGERLLGNWDWPAAGRRWDGVTAGYRRGAAHVSGFYLRPLQGGVNVQQAFHSFDSLEVYGATLFSPYAAWLPRSAFRLQAIHYDDERPAARASAGATLSLDTLAVSAIVGDDDDALVLWVATQSGDWGRSRQDAQAWFAGAGHRFSTTHGQPTLYLGYERASGDGAATAHGTFFNLLPTNHKFYGSMDYFAFSNLRDVYLEAAWKPAVAWRLQAGLHSFGLADPGDAWYGGSGAFDDRSLGYTARRPASGRFKSRDLGRELDLEATWSFRPGFELRGGGGLFHGGDAAREALPAESTGRWLYLELFFRR